MNYLRNLSRGRAVLWCYLFWYLFFACRYFDPSPSLWTTSIGISAIIGIALVISTSSGQTKLDRWQLFRLFLMPFCVSSFSALVKGRSFFLIFSPSWTENLTALALCAFFFLSVITLQSRPSSRRP